PTTRRVRSPSAPSDTQSVTRQCQRPPSGGLFIVRFLQLQQRPDVEGRLLVGVGLTQCSHRLLDGLVLADHFHPVLGDLFQPARLPDEGIGTGAGAALSLTQHLPAAVLVVAHTPGAGIEYRLLDRLEMVLVYIETELVQASLHMAQRAAVLQPCARFSIPPPHRLNRAPRVRLRPGSSTSSLMKELC